MRFSLAVLLAWSFPASAGDWGLNVYGASYHFERGRAKALNLDNEINPGLGVRYRAPLDERADWFFDAGFYRDSRRNTALIGGPGAFWKPVGGWRVGGALAFFNSNSYNGGRAFIAVVPIAAYEWRSATLNVTYFPRISNFNEINTLGVWLTVWPSAWQ